MEIATGSCYPNDKSLGFYFLLFYSSEEMISYQSIIHQNSRICIVENRFSIKDLLGELSNPCLYKDELEKLKLEHRKREFLGIRVALKKALDGAEKEIEYTYDGKPILKDGSHKISFSHCKSCVAVIVHPELDVGIDVELPSAKLSKIHTRFLGQKELEFYEEINSFDFLRIAWSAKEALYKIIGDKAYNFAEQLRILPFQVEKKGALNVLHTDTGKLYKLHYMLLDAYTLAYCIDE